MHKSRKSEVLSQFQECLYTSHYESKNIYFKKCKKVSFEINLGLEIENRKKSKYAIWSGHLYCLGCTWWYDSVLQVGSHQLIRTEMINPSYLIINPPITSTNRFCFWPHLNLNSEANDSLGVMTIKIWSALQPEVTKKNNPPPNMEKYPHPHFHSRLLSSDLTYNRIPSHHPEMRCHLEFTRLVSSGIAHQRACGGWQSRNLHWYRELHSSEMGRLW